MKRFWMTLAGTLIILTAVSTTTFAASTFSFVYDQSNWTSRSAVESRLRQPSHTSKSSLSSEHFLTDSLVIPFSPRSIQTTAPTSRSR